MAPANRKKDATMDMLKYSDSDFGVIIYTRPAVCVPVRKESDGTFTIGLPKGNESGKAVRCSQEKRAALQGAAWGELSKALNLGASEVSEIARTGGKLRATLAE
jgi:hypothetical protein